MKFPERYRAPHPGGFEHRRGDDFGWFEVPSPIQGRLLRIQASAADDDIEFDEWDHVSVSIAKGYTPTWMEMCFVKDLFWDSEDVIVQFHPKKSEYVNFAMNCLHLWRWTKGEFPTPPPILVGPIK